MKTLFLRVAATTAVAMLFISPAASAQPLPPAADIIARHVAAIGGRDAVLAIVSLQQKGTFEIRETGMRGATELLSAPNRVLVKQTLDGIGDMLSGYDGTVGWSSDPMSGPRLMQGKELLQMQEGADFRGELLHSPDRFSLMETVAIVDFNGEKAYKLHLVRKPSGTEATEYFSVATGLQIGSETTTEAPMGKLQLTVSIGEYKQFGALKFATKNESMAAGMHVIATIEHVSINNVPASTFELPPQIKALVRR